MEVSGKSLLDGTPLNNHHQRRPDPRGHQGPREHHRQRGAQGPGKDPPELVGDIARNGLLLAGGGALLRGLDQLITQETNLSVFVDDDPLTTVVRGTGKTLDDRQRYANVFIN